MAVPTKYETDYQHAKKALGSRDPIADLASLNRRLHKRGDELRALREALAELLDALDESYGGKMDAYPGRLMTAYTEARVLSPDPAHKT